MTQRICLSDWLVSCLNAYQSLDFKEPFLKESTPHRPPVWSVKVVMLTSTTATFPESLWHKDWLLFPIWSVRRRWGHACLCILIYNYDLQGIWMSPLSIQSKIDDQYKSFKTLNTPEWLTVPPHGNRFSFFCLGSPSLYVYWIHLSLRTVFPWRYAHTEVRLKCPLAPLRYWQGIYGSAWLSKLRNL